MSSLNLRPLRWAFLLMFAQPLPAMALSCAPVAPVIAGSPPPSTLSTCGGPCTVPDTTLVFIGELADWEFLEPRALPRSTKSREPRFFAGVFAVDRMLRGPKKTKLNVLVIRPTRWPGMQFSNEDAALTMAVMASGRRKAPPAVHLLPAPSEEVLAGLPRSVTEMMTEQKLDAVLRLQDCGEQSYQADEPIGRYLINALSPAAKAPAAN